MQLLCACWESVWELEQLLGGRRQKSLVSPFGRSFPSTYSVLGTGLDLGSSRVLETGPSSKARSPQRWETIHDLVTQLSTGGGHAPDQVTRLAQPVLTLPMGLGTLSHVLSPSRQHP